MVKQKQEVPAEPSWFCWRRITGLQGISRFKSARARAAQSCVPHLKHNPRLLRRSRCLLWVPALARAPVDAAPLASHKDRFPAPGDHCAFTGLSTTLYDLSWHSFGCSIEQVFVSTHGSPLLFLILLIGCGGVIGW